MGVARVPPGARAWLAASRRRPAWRIPVSWLLWMAALFAGAITGLLIAVALPLGVGFVGAICMTLAVAVSLPVALALLAGVLFVRYLPFVSIGPTFVALLVLLGWLATLDTRRRAFTGLLERHRPLLTLLAGMLLWASLSLLWARDPGDAGGQVWHWYVAAVVFIVVATTVLSAAHVRLILTGFVLGAVISVVFGFAGGGLESSSDAIERATATEGRLQGGGGDPNYLAAGLVPAVLFAAALMAGTRRALIRVGLLAAMVVIALGFAAAQSRGGLLAAAVVSIGTLFTFRGRGRVYAIAITTIVLGAGSLWFVADPAAWTRLTSFDDGGNGRTELWQVATRMAGDHPLAGVGLGNFLVWSPDYVREPGDLESVRLIVERPHVVHNMYLQLLSELGAVGVALFVGLVVACMAAAWRAARLFDRVGEVALGVAARAVLLSQIAMLVAGVFISYSTDERLWLLMALGPALLAIAMRSRLPGGQP